MTPDVQRLLAERDSRIADLEKREAALREELEAQRQEWLAERERLMKELDALLLRRRFNEEEIDVLKFRIRQLTRQIYGRKADQMEDADIEERISLQDDLFGEQPPATKEEKREEAKEPEPKRRRRPRKPLPANLPRTAVVIDIKEEEKACDACGADRRKIGEDVTEELEYIPAKLFVRRTVRPRYACASCKDAVSQAPLPPRLLPKSGAGTSLVASLIVSKYLDHVPLCRLERIFKRHDIDIDRARMCDWLMKTSERLAPLVDLMKRRLTSGFVLGVDETPVKMQLAGKHRRGKAVRTCYMWVYHGDETAPFTIHDFQETRGRDGPEGLLKPFEGYLQSDGYTVYKSLANSEEFSFKRAGCMAHARRKFVEAHESGDARAAEAVALFGELYAVEKRLPDVKEAERTEYRREHAGPVMKRLKTWLQERVDVLPKSALGTAIGYMLDNWAPLEAYLDDARIPIDNNAVERAIRPIAVGRRNWLFMGSARGGRAAAILFTLLESCQQNGHNPWTYMTDILTRLPSTPAEDLSSLLPDTWKPACSA